MENYMSKTAFSWHASNPPEPDVYTTRRNESKHLTLRYWDGERWYEINVTGARGGDVFKWPKKSRTRQPVYFKHYKETLRIRKIGEHQGLIQWGEPHKVYNEREVLNYLVKSGRLREDWREAYQEPMRVRAAKVKGGAA
jgi:hypothetical protein